MNNLKLEFGSKSLDYLNGEAHRTRVVLTNDDGTYYPIFFEPEAINKPDAELYQMALEVNYQKNSSGRAEDERFNILGLKVSEIDDAIERFEKFNEQIAKISEQRTLDFDKMKSEFEGMQGALLEFMEQVLTSMPIQAGEGEGSFSIGD